MTHVEIPERWTADEALAVVYLLERAADAIWRAHGVEMGLRYADLHLPTPRRMRTHKQLEEPPAIRPPEEDIPF